MTKFICVWDMYGIESVIDITEFELEEDQRLLDMIATGKPVASKFGQLLTPLLLRARLNSQRNYEIYAIEAASGITDTDLYDMFKNNPQASADLIRKNGIMIFNGRQDPKPVIA